MRNTIFALTSLRQSIVAQAQFTYPIKADAVLIAKEYCNAELNLENGTRHVKGFLYNKGNGRTQFLGSSLCL